MPSYDAIIIGAGMVGMATTYHLQCANPHWRLLVIEKESGVAYHQSGRNSGVVHTGVYYKPGSLKATNCLQGRKALLAFCDQNNVPYRCVHKLIVATRTEERPRLQEIYSRGIANGVPGLKILSSQETKEIEPHVSAIEALLVPECHIVEFAQVAQSLHAELVKKGVEFAFNREAKEIRTTENGSEIVCSNQTYLGSFFINCGGLHSDRLSNNKQGMIIPFRGEYYELKKEKSHLVKGLIYPVPDPNFPFLGVHLTIMMNGLVEAGPNAVLALAKEGYRKHDFSLRDLSEIFSFPGFWKMAGKYWKTGVYEVLRSLSKSLFLRDLQRLIPAIQKNDLLPGNRGIRAQFVLSNGSLADDFILEQKGHSIHVINAPSPAATASFCIGAQITQMVMKKNQGALSSDFINSRF